MLENCTNFLKYLDDFLEDVRVQEQDRRRQVHQDIAPLLHDLPSEILMKYRVPRHVIMSRHRRGLLQIRPESMELRLGGIQVDGVAVYTSVIVS